MKRPIGLFGGKTERLELRLGEVVGEYGPGRRATRNFGDLDVTAEAGGDGADGLGDGGA